MFERRKNLFPGDFKVSQSNSWKITSFSKTTLLHREPLLTMFYTINLSPFCNQVSFYAKKYY